MYHAIVRRKVLSLLEAVNRGDAEPVLTGFAPAFEHVMIGDHALSGRRRTLAATREWYARLYRLLPDISFTLDRVTVWGAPWRTVAVAEWRETNSGTDGIRTHATGVHIAEIAWGRIVRLTILPDSVQLKATLDRLAAKGVAEAAAAPLDEAPGWPAA